MFYLELVSGIRKGELVALRWEDLDVEQRTISVSKQATKDADNNLIVARPETSCQGLFNQIHEKATKKVPEADFSS